MITFNDRKNSYKMKLTVNCFTTKLCTVTELNEVRLTNVKMPGEIKIADIPEKKFKPFNDTFPHCAFALAISLIYPSQRTVKIRLALVGLIVTVNSFILFWFGVYLARCIRRKDIFNLSRNVTIGILAILFFFKTFYLIYKTDKYHLLLKKISDDLVKGNDMEEDYQEIYEYYINLGKFGQTLWIFIPIFLSSQFPMYAGGCMIYENLMGNNGNRYMVHEMELKFIEDKQYETPYFELMFGYNLIQCVVLSPNFAGFDGSFCIATNHLRLKLKLFAHKVCKAFKVSNNKYELRERLKDAIKDHQDALNFYNDLQEIYGVWLFVVFLLTAFIISLNVLLIYLSDRIDPKYIIFALSGVIHMLTPCYFASDLMKTSEELSWDLYDASWEAWADPVATNLLIFMIAKSQQILILTGMGMVYFNMQLFISVMQTSYSFFTLISS